MASIPACPEKPARRWRPLHGVFRGPGEKGSSGFGPPKRVHLDSPQLMVNGFDEAFRRPTAFKMLCPGVSFPEQTLFWKGPC